MQGLITCALALGSYFLIVDFPEQAARAGFQLKFLNEEESAFIVARIEKDRHDAIPEQFKVGMYLKNSLDLKVWGFAALFMLTTTCTYAMAYFLPIILNEGLGFSVAASECLICPPSVAAAIVMYGWAYMGDKYHIRAPFILINGMLLLIGKPCAFPTPKQRNNETHRPPTSRLREKQWRPLFRRLSRHYRLQCQHSLRAHLPGKQHPWSVEARSLLRHFGRRWWHRRHYWQHCIQRPRQAGLQARYLRYDDCWWAYHHYHACNDVQV
jgi:hypothetical protein